MTSAANTAQQQEITDVRELVLDAGGVVAQSWVRLDWSIIVGTVQVSIRFHKRPRSPPAGEFQCGSRLTPSFIIYDILNSKKQKMSQSFSNNISSFNTNFNNFTVADDRSDILAWLSPLEPGLRHQDIQDRRVENIGEWLLQSEGFRSWYAGSESYNAVLFCYGDPGVGKTYIR